MTARFPSSVPEVVERLGSAGYIADTPVATTVFLALRLGKPLLVEGPAGVGKTELAKATARSSGLELVRLQCYEGLDEARALYEWNYRKQLLRIQADEAREHSWSELEDSIFDEAFLLERPLLKAIRSVEPVVLLVDEVDRTEFEFEAFLLELLSDFQVTLPELGTLVARHIPVVFLTSNATRELSEALKRRCLYLYMDYPEQDREKQIILSRVPELPEALADQMVRILHSIRQLELRKSPSISESLDWARTILELGIGTLDETATRETLAVILKHRQDLDRVTRELKLSAQSPPR
ncbi:MAG TPA: MoxR family ATPase [Actinomycetota bacterium]|nr:MoxR family ATPase [Actinomycetota bacterium]